MYRTSIRAFARRCTRHTTHALAPKATLCVMLVAAPFLTACQQSYRKTMDAVTSDCARGRYIEASTLAATSLEKLGKNDGDRLIYLLEAGRTAQLAGNLEASNAAFEEAHTIVKPYLDEKAEASITEAGATTVVNQTVSEYRGTNPERTLLETMLAMNALVRGNREQARIALNRAQAWQQIAIQLNEAEIEREQARLDASKEEAASKGVSYGASSEIEANTNYANLASMKAYADYADPFATYLRGVFLLFEPDATDLENASYAFRRTQALNNGNAGVAAHIAGDLALVEAKRSDGQIPPHTWIVLFDGMAAYRKEFSVGVAAFPYMEQRAASVTAPQVTSGNESVAMSSVSDFDRMVMADFKEKLPLIITQEIISTALKSAATYMMKEQLGSYGLLIGLAYQFGSTAADLRSWRTAPKLVHVARVRTPDDGRITLSDAGVAFATVAVSPRTSAVVFVDVPARGAPAAVRSAVLAEAVSAVAEPNDAQEPVFALDSATLE